MNNRWNEAVRKLIQLTASGSLTWSHVENGRFPVGLGIQEAFLTDVQGRRVVVTVAADRFDDDYYGSGLGPDDHYDPMPTIQFARPDLTIIWRWPVDSGLSELLDTIRFRAAAADEFLDHFLGGATEDRVTAAS